MAKFSESNISIINLTEIEQLIKGSDIAYFNASIAEDLDVIGNGKWDEEGFKWSQNLSGNSEAFTDINSNNNWDEEEPFVDKDGLVDIGKGSLYYTKRFNMLIVWLGLLVCLGGTVYVGLISYNQISRQMRSYDPNN